MLYPFDPRHGAAGLTLLVISGGDNWRAGVAWRKASGGSPWSESAAAWSGHLRATALRLPKARFGPHFEPGRRALLLTTTLRRDHLRLPRPDRPGISQAAEYHRRCPGQRVGIRSTRRRAVQQLELHSTRCGLISLVAFLPGGGCRSGGTYWAIRRVPRYHPLPLGASLPRQRHHAATTSADIHLERFNLLQCRYIGQTGQRLTLHQGRAAGAAIASAPTSSLLYSCFFAIRSGKSALLRCHGIFCGLVMQCVGCDTTTPGRALIRHACSASISFGLLD